MFSYFVLRLPEESGNSMSVTLSAFLTSGCCQPALQLMPSLQRWQFGWMELLPDLGTRPYLGNGLYFADQLLHLRPETDLQLSHCRKGGRGQTITTRAATTRWSWCL